MTYRIYVGSYSSEIYALEFNPQAASLTLLSTITVGHHPSWITSHPSDPTFIFTALEQSDGKIIALKYDKKGQGKIVTTVPSGGADPCVLFAKDDELLIGNVSDRICVIFLSFIDPVRLN
jgi:6-phosphogluconolactonase (cycloisomerase 2 family)